MCYIGTIGVPWFWRKIRTRARRLGDDGVVVWPPPKESDMYRALAWAGVGSWDVARVGMQALKASGAASTGYPVLMGPRGRVVNWLEAAVKGGLAEDVTPDPHDHLEKWL